MLHPSQADLGVPFPFVPELWRRTQSGTDGSISPIQDGSGIQLKPDSVFNSWIQMQAYQGFNFLPGFLVIVAARILLTELAQCDCWFGTWDKHDNVFDGNLGRGVFWKKAAGDQFFVGRAQNDVPPPFHYTETAPFPAFAEGTFVDLAIVVRATQVADFLWARPDGTWLSQSVSADIPTDHRARMPFRPAFVYRQHQYGYAVIRSVYLEELRLTE